MSSPVTTSSTSANTKRAGNSAIRNDGRGRVVARGAVAGVLASLVMAMFAMVASATYQHHGFFTPLYHIASTIISPSHLMMSVQAAAAGDTFDFIAGPALLGASIHMMVGAMFGAMFAALVAVKRLPFGALIGAGALWGVAVFAISSFMALPLAASMFGSGDQITHMATMVGYRTFVAEHVLYGLALAAVLATGRARADNIDG